ncbi:unnamed protein product [Gordionus sp. m RMFG-2023]
MSHTNPQKRNYRQRAHSNPISYRSLYHPIRPQSLNLGALYAESNLDKKIEFVDIGCGYGGLLTHLSPIFPNVLMLGLEIRTKVSDFVIDTIKSLREYNEISHAYGNIACIRTNAMKYLPNFFDKKQVKKLFILFPDPHFKKSKHKWRFVSETMIAEIAYILHEDGLVYSITDVFDMHEWISKHFNEHPLFAKLSNDEKVLI